MPDNNEITNALSRVRPEEMRFDRNGRVTIDNRELAERLGRLGVAEVDPSDLKASGNGICCGNDNCGAAEEVVRLFEGVIRGRLNPPR
ncbi:MAG: hypothetical protein R3F65_31330 [bacterium]|nr:hypothetical protein [Myxococcales bacterium]MCB9553123.1 hypothetical protein [Myxococcales bacterium]